MEVSRHPPLLCIALNDHIPWCSFCSSLFWLVFEQLKLCQVNLVLGGKLWQTSPKCVLCCLHLLHTGAKLLLQNSWGSDLVSQAAQPHVLLTSPALFTSSKRDVWWMALGEAGLSCSRQSADGSSPCDRSKTPWAVSSVFTRMNPTLFFCSYPGSSSISEATLRRRWCSFSGSKTKPTSKKLSMILLIQAWSSRQNKGNPFKWH